MDFAEKVASQIIVVLHPMSDGHGGSAIAKMLQCLRVSTRVLHASTACFPKDLMPCLSGWACEDADFAVHCMSLAANPYTAGAAWVLRHSQRGAEAHQCRHQSGW